VITTIEINKPQGVKYKPSKWDWEKIDKEVSEKLPTIIKNLEDSGTKITKHTLSLTLGLKDFPWRSLPMTKRVY
jgi:hypothetical protein